MESQYHLMKSRLAWSITITPIQYTLRGQSPSLRICLELGCPPSTVQQMLAGRTFLFGSQGIEGSSTTLARLAHLSNRGTPTSLLR